MPWSKHRNKWHRTQWECDMDDARAEAELAAVRSGRPGTVVEVVEEDFFGNRTVTTRRTNRYGTTTTVEVETSYRWRTEEEAAEDLIRSAFDLFL